MTSNRPYNDVEVELRQEIRGLAYEMVRFEQWARDAAEFGYFDQVAEMHHQRELAMARRSQLLRELWGRI